MKRATWICAALMLLLGPYACKKPLAPLPHNATPSGEAFVGQQPAAHAAPAQEAKKPESKIGNMPIGAKRMTEANTLYQERCALCHGAKGLGDGVVAVNLRPQPRSFASSSWQAETSDESIIKIIVEGGASVGRSFAMPPARDLQGQTELLHALCAVVRNFGPGGAKAAP